MDFEKALREVARSYEDEGYVVIVHPDKDHLPDFALDFGPDLLATRPNERVLVEVKEDRSDLEADPKVLHRVEITNRQAGWRYDLHVLKEDDSLRKVARVAGEPTPERIEQMLRDAEFLLDTLPLPEEMRLKSPELDETVRRSAFLQTWAALEAAMRHSDGVLAGFQRERGRRAAHKRAIKFDIRVQWDRSDGYDFLHRGRGRWRCRNRRRCRGSLRRPR